MGTNFVHSRYCLMNYFTHVPFYFIIIDHLFYQLNLIFISMVFWYYLIVYHPIFTY